MVCWSWRATRKGTMEHLLASYGSEDEERPEAEEDQSIKSKKRKLALPDAGDLLVDTFQETTGAVYSTVLTNGKVVLGGSRSAKQKAITHGKKDGSTDGTATTWARNVSHKDGNWASYVYIKVPNDEDFVAIARASIHKGHQRLTRGIEAMEKDRRERRLQTHEQSEQQQQEPSEGGGGSGGGGAIDRQLSLVENDMSVDNDEACQHLSLSRTVYLRSHHITPFVEDIRRAVEWATSFTVGVSDEMQLLVNDERTRSFLALQVDQGTAKLQRLVESVDGVLKRYRQPAYYEDPIFHISVASAVGDWSKEWSRGGDDDGGGGDGDDGDDARASSIDVDTVRCRIGDKLFEIQLREE